MRRPRYGFTLIEMLATMTIMTLVLVVIADIYITAATRWSKLAAQSASRQYSALALERMGQEIRTAMSFQVDTVNSNTVYTLTFPNAVDASGSYVPVSSGSGLAYQAGGRTRYYLSNISGGLNATGGQILWRATAPAGSTVYTPDTSWSLIKSNVARYENIRSLNMQMVSGLIATVQINITLRATEGTSSNDYSLSRNIAMKNSNSTTASP
jgi:prepilin-type N-terminal cleavage/methylation domain-containing protein